MKSMLTGGGGGKEGFALFCHLQPIGYLSTKMYFILTTKTLIKNCDKNVMFTTK